MRYKVMLSFTQISVREKIIEADSLDEAQQLAEEFGSADVDWKPVDGDVAVQDVALVG